MKSVIHPKIVIGESADNLLRGTLQNQYITYLSVTLLVIYIGLYHRFSPETRENIQNAITNPVVIGIIITINFVLSFYNMLIAILILVAIIITFSPRNSKKQLDNKVVEGFEEKGKRHQLMKHFNLNIPKSITSSVEEGMAENRRVKASERVSKINKKNIINGDKKTADLTIKRRKFNPDDKADENLINTRQICRDIINRIDYKYEDRSYLLKYIASRLEEIVDLNRLLDDDDDNDE